MVIIHIYPLTNLGWSSKQPPPSSPFFPVDGSHCNANYFSPRVQSNISVQPMRLVARELVLLRRTHEDVSIVHLKMEEIWLTSWGWQFLPLFTGFDDHPRRCRISSINNIKSSWWLNQPIWKICSSNWIMFSTRGENNILKPPPRN